MWIKVRKFKKNTVTTMTALPKDISRLQTALLRFEKGEVLQSLGEVSQRAEAIHKATYLGNLKHTKVSILFSAQNELFTVNTTIWLHYNGEIFLKDDVKLPVERVLAIYFYS